MVTTIFYVHSMTSLTLDTHELDPPRPLGNVVDLPTRLLQDLVMDMLLQDLVVVRVSLQVHLLAVFLHGLAVELPLQDLVVVLPRLQVLVGVLMTTAANPPIPLLQDLVADLPIMLLRELMVDLPVLQVAFVVPPMS